MLAEHGFPAVGTLDGRYVYFECDEFEIDAKPAPYILVTLAPDGTPSSTGRQTRDSAFQVLGNRLRDRRVPTVVGAVYEQRGDTWHRIESNRARARVERTTEMEGATHAR